LIPRHFNAVTPADAMGWAALRPSRGDYRFEPADRVADFADANGLRLRGPSLVWHRRLPPWLGKLDATREGWKALLREHVQTVASRYRGRVYCWDVVSEALNGGGGFRHSLWRDAVGEEYVELAFRWAREADPEARLFYSDAAAGLNAKSDGMYQALRRWLQAGVPIHGVGLQLLEPLGMVPPAHELAANMERLGALGLEVHVASMDIALPQPVTQRGLKAQGREYGEAMRACLQAPTCAAFCVGGVSDRDAGASPERPGYGASALLDAAGTPKPAYRELVRLLSEA
jgi:endo-1,4-beta-xylanase